jgi:succinylglutamate desuccinylase
MDSFANSYVEARSKFLQAATLAKLTIQTMKHPLPGPGAEELATDVVVLGEPKASKALYVTSGVHGVEGYYGSGVMVQWLRQNLQAPAGCKIILVHACNPYGFAHGRRFTEENVDLNRNFWPLDQAPLDNPHYQEIRDFIEYPACNTETFQQCQQARAAYVQEKGMAGLKIALSNGQQQSPQGLFFAGTQPTWARNTFETLVEEHTRGCEQVFFLDLHTGLGPRGYADFLHQYAPASQQLKDLLAYMGECVNDDERGEASAQELDGTTIACFQHFAEKLGYQVIGGAIECGTTPLPRTLESLLQETALQRHGCDDLALARAIKQELKDCFYVNEDDWKQQVFEQTNNIKDNALRYLQDR